jgi:hypothetical protein
MLHDEIVCFVNRVIRTRLALIRNGVNKLDEKEALYKVKILQDLIIAYGYKTDESASNFLLRHLSDIEMLLPGSSSMAYFGFKKSLDKLVEQARQQLSLCSKVS